MKSSRPTLVRASLAGLAAAALLVPGLRMATAQDVQGRRPARPRVYEGTSRRGNFQEALDDAVAKALRALPGADRMVRYRVQEITGEHGGIAGASVLRVAVEVTDRGGQAPPAQNPPAAQPGEDLSRVLRADLDVMPERVDQRGSVTFQLRVRNTSDRAVPVTMPSGQQMEFEVRRAGGTIWRWSDGRVFTQALQMMSLAPNQSLTLTGRWNLRNRAGDPVPPGRYEVSGWLTAQSRGRVGAEGTLTVIPR